MMLTRSIVRTCSRSAATRCRAFSTTTTTTTAVASSSSGSSSPWASFEMAPPDPIIGLNEAYQKDDFPQKVIVGVGAYRDDQGKPYVLPCVRQAEQRIMQADLVSR